MAVRVNKLARELETSPDRLLHLLSAVGYDRYRSANDMVADVPAAKVRKFASELRKSGDFERVSHGGASPSAGPARSAPIEEQLAPDLDRPIEEIAAEVVPGGQPPAALAEASQALRAERAHVETLRRKLVEREHDLSERVVALQAERASLQAERAALLDQLSEARSALESRAADLDAIEAGGVPVVSLLDERGLLGSDEHGRALSALATARLLDPVLSRLRVIDSHGVRRLLQDRLLLAAGPLEGVEGVAVVQVAPERAEVPPTEELHRLCDRLWGEFLLCGLRRVVWIGLSALEQRLLRNGVDPRLTVQMLPGQSRDAEGARHDVESADVVVLRGVTLSEQARAVYAASGTPVLTLESRGLRELVSEACQALSTV